MSIFAVFLSYLPTTIFKRIYECNSTFKMYSLLLWKIFTIIVLNVVWTQTYLVFTNVVWTQQVDVFWLMSERKYPAEYQHESTQSVVCLSFTRKLFFLRLPRSTLRLTFLWKSEVDYPNVASKNYPNLPNLI